MNDNQKVLEKGLKLKYLNWIFLVLVCAMCFAVFLSSVTVKAKYNDMIFTINDYSECDKAVNEFRDASDFLTNQIRFYAINQDYSFLKAYLSEAETVRRREVALEIVEMTHFGDDIDISLKKALNESSLLVEREYYSAKLVYSSIFSDNREPQSLKEIQLLPEDLNLTAENKLEKAKNLLFDSSYIKAKNSINNYCSFAITALINNSIRTQKLQTKKINQLFIVFILSLAGLLIVSLLYIILIILNVLRPIYNHIKKIEAGEKMESFGSYETRYIANSYNSLMDKNEIKTSILKHKAEHDSLTGLINREALDHIKKILSDSTESIAYLIIDIDYFKQINDNYGHQTGDEILKKIANLLTEQFRNTDYVGRIGGDEFAIVMTKIGDTPESVIQRKIVNINNLLQNIHDGLPSVSLSVGVSISHSGYNEKLEKQADEALYRVKKGGRCNCSFYRFQMEEN